MKPVHANLAHDPTASTETHLPDDRFVPIQTRELIDAMVADSQRYGDHARMLAVVFDRFAALFAREASTLEGSLAARYDAFNPDRDTILTPLARDERTAEHRGALLARLQRVFEKANFESLDDDQVAAMANASPMRGLRVRLDRELVDYLQIWVRGQAMTQRRMRTWRHPLRGEIVDIPMIRRFAFIVQLKDDPHILMKVFKDIPLLDMEALLPHATVQMTWWDRLVAITGGAGAAGSAALRVASVLTSIIYWPRLLWIVTFGLVVTMYRTIMGYRRARLQRDSQRTQHLYFQNLDNNSGVIHKLVAMIAEEDLKETLLTYAVCLVADPPISSMIDLKRRAEAYLSLRFNVQVEFDADDGVRGLTQLGLWSDREHFRVVPPALAVAKLESWESSGLPSPALFADPQ